jgi:sirohydrochlorin ferrochelatase
VQSDIPAAVAPYPAVRTARHLGPHPLLVDALVDRLGPVADGERVVLAATGSSRPEARGELDETARLLGRELGREVEVCTLGEDPGDWLRQRAPVAVATYLLTEGAFADKLAAAAAGSGRVAPPIGVHPALVELVWRRYDDGRKEQVR